MAMGNNKRRRSSLDQTESTVSKNSKNKKNNNNREKAATIIKREKSNISDGVEVLLRRPKVYITDISNFKTLVQELTGNGALATKTSVTVGNGLVNQSESDSVDTFSPTASVDASVDSSSDQTASFGPDEMMMMMMNKSFLYSDEELACKPTSSDDHYDLAAWDDLEALMQDMEGQDQFPLFESSNLQGSTEIHHCYEEDLSIYDYDFSGVVC